MKNLAILLIAVILYACSTPKQEEKVEEKPPVVEAEVETVTTDSAYVFFKNPKDGATVPSPVFVEMGISGMQIESAGQVKEGYGHHHILINQASWPEGTTIPMSDSTLHFGKGQTDTSIELPAGEYTLSLQLADGVHSSYGPDMSTTISITVE